MSGLFSTVRRVRRAEIKVGRQYEMQRGPTRGIRHVTVLDKEVPSGKASRVLVRVEDGISEGRTMEVPTRSIYPMPGEEQQPKKSNPRKRAQQRSIERPPGWMPRPSQAVAWTQTLGSRLTVLSVDKKRGIARIEGVVLGVTEQFEAPIAELSPYQEPRLVVHAGDVESQLGDRLPKIYRAQGAELEYRSMPAPVNEPTEEEWVEHLIFSPGCIDFYRRRFAKWASPQEAEQRLRAELRKAKKLRKRHTGEYLRLRAQGRFDAILRASPSSGSFDALYVSQLTLPAKPRRRRKRSRGRRAA